MWYTGKPYSHCARATEIRDWGKRYYQASEGKCNYEFEKYFLQKHEIIKSYTIEVSADIERQIKKACYMQAGNKYATMQNIGIFITDIYYKLFKKDIKNPWTKGQNCSEVLYSEGFKFMISGLKYSKNKIKPDQIESIILKHFKQKENGNWIKK